MFDPLWTSETATLGAPVAWRFQLEVPAPPRELWPILSDTTRLNRALGLGVVEYAEEGGVLRGSTRTRGIPYRWVELPWAWVEGQWMSCFRIYDNGFATHAAIGYAIEPAGHGGSRVRAAIDWYPRHAAGGVALVLLETKLRGAYQRAFDRIAREHGERLPVHRILAESPPPLPAPIRARLSVIREQLVAGGVPARIAGELIAHVAEGDDADLARLRVRPLARRIGVEERSLAVACLHATRAGLLQLDWDFICPHCRTVKRTAATLAEIPPRAACATCEVEFATGGPNAVEVTFRAHPSIREVGRQTYCFAETSSKQHIKLQQPVPAGQRREVATALAPGRYRARVIGEARHRVVDVSAGSAVKHLTLGDGGEGPIEVGPAPTVTLVNDSDRRRVLVIEDVQWADDALLPVHLFNLHEFRDFFSAEHLAAEVELQVGEQAILFSDIVGSTRFYEDHGDSRAFAAVKRHFQAIDEEVRRHRGVVVKTIGDAAMAAFVDPSDALRAALGVQRRFGAGKGHEGIRVRVSLNVGPCIAVNLNSGIDYFGRTVNTAAKLQEWASAGQVVFPAALRGDPRVAALLDEQRLLVEEVATSVASPTGPITVCRWTVPGDAPLEPAAPGGPPSAGFY